MSITMIMRGLRLFNRMLNKKIAKNNTEVARKSKEILEAEAEIRTIASQSTDLRKMAVALKNLGLSK